MHLFTVLCFRAVLTSSMNQRHKRRYRLGATVVHQSKTGCGRGDGLGLGCRPIPPTHNGQT